MPKFAARRYAAMRYYDITHTLNGEVPIWPGDPLFSLEQIQTIGCGSDSNLHQLSMGFTLALTWTPHTIFFPMESGSEKWSVLLHRRLSRAGLSLLQWNCRG